jgi:hypothetical protein
MENSINDDSDEEWQTKYVMDAYHAGNVSPVSLSVMLWPLLTFM